MSRSLQRPVPCATVGHVNERRLPTPQPHCPASGLLLHLRYYRERDSPAPPAGPKPSHHVSNNRVGRVYPIDAGLRRCDTPVWWDVYDTSGARSVRRHQGSGERDVDEEIESHVQAIRVRVHASDVDDRF